MKLVLYTVGVLALTNVLVPSGLANSALPEAKYIFQGELIKLPAGAFMMGTRTPSEDTIFGGTATAVPAHVVTLDAFEIGATEVTNKQYAGYLNAAYAQGLIEVSTTDRCVNRLTVSIPCYEVIGAKGQPNAGETFMSLSPHQGISVYGIPEHVLNRNWIIYSPYIDHFYVHMGMEDYPANFVKWYGAYAFAEFYGLSLPTEAQWEYAARGGAYFDHEYPFSTDDGTLDCSKVNYGCEMYNHALPWPPGSKQGDPIDPDYIGHLTPAVTEGNRYPPNPYGLYNMAGNIIEWCLDVYSPTFYQDSIDLGTTHNPVNLVDNSDGITLRVVRSTGAGFEAKLASTAARKFAPEIIGNDHFGFRVVNNNPGKKPEYKPLANN